MGGRRAARVMMIAMVATMPSAPAAASSGATAGGIGVARAPASTIATAAAPSVAAPKPVHRPRCERTIAVSTAAAANATGEVHALEQEQEREPHARRARDVDARTRHPERGRVVDEKDTGRHSGRPAPVCGDRQRRQKQAGERDHGHRGHRQDEHRRAGQDDGEDACEEMDHPAATRRGRRRWAPANASSSGSGGRHSRTGMACR